jgi:hypothetical protein
MSYRAIPLLVIVLILYNVIVYAAGSISPDSLFYGSTTLDASSNTLIEHSADLFVIPMPNGGAWHFRLGDLIFAIGIALLAVEVIKATYTRTAGLADQAFSTVVMIVFLIELLLVSKASTSLFLLLTLLAVFDVIVGAIVGIRTSRRDVGFSPLPSGNP